MIGSVIAYGIVPNKILGISLHSYLKTPEHYRSFLLSSDTQSILMLHDSFILEKRERKKIKIISCLAQNMVGRIIFYSSKSTYYVASLLCTGIDTKIPLKVKMQSRFIYWFKNKQVPLESLLFIKDSKCICSSESRIRTSHYCT